MKAGKDWVLDPAETLLVTGAAGFIGCRVVNSLLRLGFRNIRCAVRPSSDLTLLRHAIAAYPSVNVEIFSGNLLSREDCARAVHDVKAVFHLVTGRGKSFPGCFQNSVVTTRNILDAVVLEGGLTRFVNVSSFAVYSNLRLSRGGTFDENCPVEDDLEKRHDAYVYAKLRQDQLVEEYRRTHGLPIVVVRPSIVIGPGKKAIPGAVGLSTFGIFLHLGGGNRIPLTYVDNCADAIVLAGLVKGIEGETFNVVDDELPTSRSFLRQYKTQVRRFPSIYVPYVLFYLACLAWERYSAWSREQLPPVFNRRLCAFQWKGHLFSNRAAKERLQWRPEVPMRAALDLYFQYQKEGQPIDA